MTNPKDSQIFLDGSHYKIGLNKKPFIWVDGQWIRSSKKADDITRAIDEQS